MEEPQRQVAKKCTVATIQSGNYVKQEGWAPNYIESGIGHISRAHLVGVAVQQVSDTEFLFDDGTGKISVRSFESNFTLPNIGALVRLIGKPREYQDQRYLIPEIVKMLDNPGWAKLHQQDTKGQDQLKVPEPSPVSAPEAPSMVEEEVVASEPITVAQAVAPEAPSIAPAQPVHEAVEAAPVEIAPAPEPVAEEPQVEAPTQQGGQDPHTIIYTLIKNMDEGAGADYEEVVSKSNLDNGESIIESLMKEGEIFLIAPGKLKVLE